MAKRQTKKRHLLSGIKWQKMKKNDPKMNRDEKGWSENE